MHGLGKGVLDALDVLKVEEVGKADVRLVLQRLGQGQDLAFERLLGALALGDVQEHDDAGADLAVLVQDGRGIGPDDAVVALGAADDELAA